MPDVFISYSRKNKPFMERLHAALKAQGRDIWVDWEDIPVTADWWREITSGIDSTDTFLFITTPESLSSPVCTVEVNHAIQQNKRVIPIIHAMPDEKAAFAALVERELDEEMRARLNGREILDVAHENWRTISRHNWLMFREEDDFDDSFGKLVKAIETDLQHVREHTRLLLRAREWDSKGRSSSVLLMGTEILAAEGWLAAGASKSPTPTELHHEYILASRQAATRRQKRTMGVLLFGIVGAIALAIFGLVQWGIAGAEFARANAALSIAEQRGTEVADRAAEAIAARNEAYVQSTLAADRAIEADQARSTSESRGTEAADRAIEADQARSTSEARGTVAAVQRALAIGQSTIAAERADEAEFQSTLAAANASEANQARLEAEFQSTLAADRAVEAEVARDDAEVNLLQARENQSRFLADLSRGALEDGKPQTSLLLALESLSYYDEFGIGGPANFNSLTAALNSTVQESAFFPVNFPIENADLSADGSRVIAWANTPEGGSVHLWQADGKPLAAKRNLPTLSSVTWNDDLSLVAMASDMGVLVLWDVSTDRVGEFDDQFYFDPNLSPDGRRLAAPFVREDSSIGLAVMDSANVVELTGWEGEYYSTIFSQNAEYVILNTILGEQFALYLYRADGTLVRRLAPDESIFFDGWSADGTRILTSTAEGQVYVFHVDTGRIALTLTLESTVFGAVWTEGDTRIVTATDTGKVQVWDMRGSLLQTMLHTSPLTAMYVTGTRILTMDDARNIVIWESGELEPFAAVNVPDATGLIGWNENATIFGVFLEDGKLRVLDFFGRFLTTLAQDDRLRGALWLGEAELFTYSGDGTARLWTLDARPPGWLWHDSLVIDAGWNADETRLLTLDSQVHVWDQDGNKLWTLAHENVDGAAWSADNAHVLTWGSDGTARIYDVVTGAEQKVMDVGAPVQAAAWNADSSRILTLIDGSVGLWDGNGSPLTSVESEDRAWWLKDGFITLTDLTDEDTRINLYDSDGNLRTSFLHPFSLYDIAPSPDGTRLFTWTEFQGYMWDMEGNLLADLGYLGQIMSASWTHDSQRLLAASILGRVYIWDSNGVGLHFVEHPPNAIGAAWSPSEQQFVSWGVDGLARVWSADGRPRVSLAHGSDTVVDLAVWHGEDELATLARNGTVQVWALPDQQGGLLNGPLARLGQNYAPRGVAWSKDGTRLLTWGGDLTARIWSLDLDTLIEQAQTVRIRDLNQFERQRAYLAAPTDETLLPTTVP